MYVRLTGIPRFDWIRMNSYAPVLEIGCADGAVFRGWEYENQVTRCDMDLYDFPNFVRCDAHNLPFKDKEFESAVLAEILEHVRDPKTVLKEAMRVSRKRVVITTPIEGEWDQYALPHMSIEESVIQKYGSIEAYYNEQKKLYPNLIEKFDDRIGPHSFHIREWTMGDFEAFLHDVCSDSGWTYSIEKRVIKPFVFIFAILSYS